MDYGMPDRRRTKNDKKVKGRFNKYKKGGRHRSDNIKIINNQGANF